MVGSVHRVFIVLYYDESISHVGEPAERSEQLVVIGLMQTDRRLIKYVEHSDKAGADLRCKSYAL